MASLSVTPGPGAPPEAADLIDCPTTIVVTGLEPLQEIVITVSSTDAAGLTWTSSLTYWASSRGEVDTAVQTIRFPQKYSGLVYWAAPFAAMEPNGKAAVDGAVYSWGTSEKGSFPRERPFHFVVTDATSGTRLGATTIGRAVQHEGDTVRDVTVLEEGFYAKFFEPARNGAALRGRRAVLMFGGSEGGLHPLIERAASLIAAHGNPALALAYFAGPSLPHAVNGTLQPALANVPLEYFRTAITWLGKQQGVDKDKIFVAGTSRGSEAALLSGVLFQDLVHGVVANVPSDIVGLALTASRQPDPWSPAWTYNGDPISYGTKIPVGLIDGPLFLDGARFDNEWQANGSDLIDRIEELRPQPNDDVIHRSNRGGHGIGALVPYLPHATAAIDDSRLRGTTALANKIDDAWLWAHLLDFVKVQDGA